MAIESQGIVINRIGTAATDVATYDATGLNVTATGIQDANPAGDFVAGGFAVGMRAYMDWSTLSTAVQNRGHIFTIKSVAATVMGFYEPAATAEDTTALAITGVNYYPIGQVTGFNGPTGAANVIDITHLGSTAKEKLIGLRDEGQVTIDVNLDTTATSYQMALKDDRAARTLRQYEIVLTDRGTALAHIPSALNYDAYVSGFAITGSVDNIVKASITMEITSAVKWISEGS